MNHEYFFERERVTMMIAIINVISLNKIDLAKIARKKAVVSPKSYLR